MVLWILIPTLIVTILIGCCVLYIKFYLLRRAATTASSALFEVARNFAPRKKNRGNQANAIRADSPNELEMEPPLFVPRIYAITDMVNDVHSTLPYIEFTINKVKVTAPLDSGASISYMKLSTLHDVAPSTSFLPKHTTATAANGTTIHLMAAVKIPITIGRYTISHQLWIASDSDCPAQVLLGSDFIRQLNKTGLPISLDLHKHVIAIGEDHHNLVQVNHVTIRAESPLHVMTEGTVTLPRRTTSIVRTKILGSLPSETMDVLIEDNQRWSDDLYVVGRALVSLNTDGTSFINIMNPSNTDIQLKDKTKIAWATPIVYPDVQILAVHHGPAAPNDGMLPTRERERKSTSPRPIPTNNNSLTKGPMNLDASPINSSCRIVPGISLEPGIVALHSTEATPADADRPTNGQHNKTNAALHPIASSEAPDNQQVTYSG
ncbi:unnamed protein product [Heligmosomoides polygyrus]|uniref:Peptidase A2 domain-containing protein n=1 Tax=Heligmosomoides polygyrus TaxID=6339 RepID=A0A183FRC7_HELPZ|nr:unnamed protein product [Heligmosomoides polygyrus]